MTLAKILTIVPHLNAPDNERPPEIKLIVENIPPEPKSHQHHHQEPKSEKKATRDKLLKNSLDLTTVEPKKFEITFNLFENKTNYKNTINSNPTIVGTTLSIRTSFLTTEIQEMFTISAKKIDLRISIKINPLKIIRFK
jgi:hypothetical protein